MRKLAKLTPIAVAVTLAGPLHAADFVVTHYIDSVNPDTCAPNSCSLREALISANGNPGPDRILLSAGVYTVTLFGADDDAGAGDLDVLDTVEIVGAGAPFTNISGTTVQNEAEPLITVLDAASLTIRDATIDNGDEGGIKVFGELLLERCEVKNNSFQGSEAGIAGTNATITIRDSAVINNGDGVVCLGGDLVLENVTMHSNNGFQLALTNTVSARCTHCTIIDEQDGGNGEIRLDNSILQLGASIVEGNCDLLNGASIDTLGGNLESPGHTCGLLPHAGDLEDVADVGRATSLANNGGPTRTFQIDADSPAVGLVVPADCLDRDQRGVSRGKLGLFNCDAGALERSNTRPPTPIFIDGFQQGDPEAWSAAVGVV